MATTKSLCILREGRLLLFSTLKLKYLFQVPSPFEIESYIKLALDLLYSNRQIALNSHSSCLYLLGAGITRVSPHLVCGVLLTEPRALCLPGRHSITSPKSTLWL